MTKLHTLVNKDSDGFKENAEAYEKLLVELRDRTEEARKGGGEKARKRHEERGKLPVRDRIDLLLDPNTAFLELSPLAAFGMYDGNVPARLLAELKDAADTAEALDARMEALHRELHGPVGGGVLRQA